MKTLLLIDSHALIYRMYHGMAPLTGPNGEPVGALYGIARLLLDMREKLKPDYVAACFDRPEPTFRKVKYELYKATRQPAPPELIEQLQGARGVFEAFKIPVVELAGFEADDLIGTLAEKFKGLPDLQVVITSGDRDLLQLVDDDKVVVDLIKTGTEGPIHFNQAKVVEEYGLLPSQMIELKGFVGDTSDNIPGINGVGPKTATPLLKEFGTIENVFENLVIVSKKVAQKFEGHLDVALLSRELATIKRDVPISIKKLEELKIPSVSKKELIDYFAPLGFVSLIERVEKEI